MSNEQGAGLSNEESIPNLREALDKAKADNNTLQEQFNQVSGELKGMKAKEAFRAGGYQDSHAELFLKANPDADITNETVSEFVTSYNLSPQSAPVEQSAGLSDMGQVADNTSPSVVGTPEGGKISKADYKKLQASDPTAAHEALIQGKVEMRGDNYVANQTFNQ
tara:strand:- start:433 stop:927 length:495 start_codon:yes stop_codon:yes gene_type:complete